MKKTIFALIFVLISGLLLANAPPGNDYVVQSDQYELQMTIDQPAVAMLSQATEVFYPVTAIDLGGVVLQTYEASWSATISKDYTSTDGYYVNQYAERNARDGLLYSLGYSTATLNQPQSDENFLEYTTETIQEVEVPDVGEVDATWRYQETYI